MNTWFQSFISTLLIVILLLLPMPILATESDCILTEYPFKDFITDIDLPDSNELFAGYAEQTLYPDRVATFGISAKARLDERNKSLYDAVKRNIEKIANGETDSAVFQVDTDALKNIQTSYPNSSTVGADFWSQFDYKTIFNALLHDCAYEFYWFDKTIGGGATGFQISHDPGTDIISFNAIDFSFQVAKDYQPHEYDAKNPKVNIAKTGAAKNVVTAAASIVKQYSDLSDYEKLSAYKTTICSLVDYDHNAAGSNYDGGYGDPWQIIYVFDNDRSTKVVCEGYAKAFQYLCDLSVFDGDICCYTVSGQMQGGTGAGGHMWNIVTMGNKKNYLVDITNSDSGSIGQGGELFLAGTGDSLSGGYQFTIDANNWIAFTYDTNTVTLWGSDADSILNLSASNYEPEAFHVAYAKVTNAYQDKIVVEKSHNVNNDLVLKIKPKRQKALPEMLHYLLVYDSHNVLEDIRLIPCERTGDSATLTISNPHVNPDETYKIIVWADNQAPLIDPICDIAK